MFLIFLFLKLFDKNLLFDIIFRLFLLFCKIFLKLILMIVKFINFFIFLNCFFCLFFKKFEGLEIRKFVVLKIILIVLLGILLNKNLVNLLFKLFNFRVDLILIFLLSFVIENLEVWFFIVLVMCELVLK